MLKRIKEEKSSTDELRIGEYVFYPKRQELIDSSAQTVKLSYKESRLLELLLQNKNQVLERKLALMRLWGDDNFFNTRNMDVYITKLRKKLKEDTSVEIVNVRGFGYKLIC